MKGAEKPEGVVKLETLAFTERGPGLLRFFTRKVMAPEIVLSFCTSFTVLISQLRLVLDMTSM